MLKHRESHALRLVPLRSFEAEDTRLLELVHGGRLSKAALRQMLRQVDLKKVGLAAGGAAAPVDMASYMTQIWRTFKISRMNFGKSCGSCSCRLARSPKPRNQR